MKKIMSVLAHVLYLTAFVSALYALSRPEFRDIGIYLVPSLFFAVTGMALDPQFEVKVRK